VAKYVVSTVLLAPFVEVMVYPVLLQELASLASPDRASLVWVPPTAEMFVSNVFLPAGMSSKKTTGAAEAETTMVIHSVKVTKNIFFILPSFVNKHYNPVWRPLKYKTVFFLNKNYRIPDPSENAFAASPSCFINRQRPHVF
jgi:hypothetical protein